MGGAPDNSAQKKRLAEREAELEKQEAEEAEAQQEAFLSRRKRRRGRSSLINDLENLGSRTNLGGGDK